METVGRAWVELVKDHVVMVAKLKTALMEKGSELGGVKPKRPIEAKEDCTEDNGAQSTHR